MKKISLIIFALTVIFSACKKDDEPKPNLRTMPEELPEVAKDTFYVFEAEGNMYYQYTWKIYSDEEKKNLVASVVSEVFQGEKGKKYWLPIAGAGNLTGNSYWVYSETKRGPDGKNWYSNLNGSYHAQGFGWWEEDGKIYTF